MNIGGLICRLAVVGIFSSRLWASETPGNQFVFRPALDILWLGVAGMGALGLNAFEEKLASSSCRWCDRNAFDDSVRNHLRWSHTKAANNLSHAFAYGLGPLWAVGSTLLDHDEGFWPNAVVISEAAMTAELLAKGIQILSARRRPDAEGSSKDNTSFCSGHSSVAFAVAVAAGTNSTLRNDAHRAWIWGVGLVLASTTAYLRVAADRHYFSDVLMGAAVGSIVGISVPWLHFSLDASETRKLSLQILPNPSGIVASLKW